MLIAVLFLEFILVGCGKDNNFNSEINVYTRDAASGTREAFQALKQIKLNIEKNKVTALIGPSGCGKSTFIRCLNRMNDLIDSCKIYGEITNDNKNIFDIDVVHLRTKVGMVFQKPNPFPMGPR